VRKCVKPLSLRVLLLQMLSHTLIFAALQTGSLAERALLAADSAATAALGLNWIAFCLLFTFTTNVVGVGRLVVGRYSGAGDQSAAQAAVRQALLLAGGGGVLGLAIAATAATASLFLDGVARSCALFLATQGLALGPLLAARVLTDYFAATMQVAPRLLVAVTLLPAAVHVALVWLMTGLLSWSVGGVGLARFGAAVVAAAAALALAGGARAEFGCLGGPPWRGDRALLWSMFAEGSVLGCQQVVAGLMVVMLYLATGGAGDVTSAALTLTHGGAYPLLFAFAWGNSQAVGAAAAQAVGRRDSRELARVIRMGLGLAVVLAVALPWGAYGACGKPALAWLVANNPDGAAMLAASVRFMGLLAIFFVFDFAINFLSALLSAAKQQAFLLRVTIAAAASFGLLLVSLPPAPDGPWVMGAFITAQATWAVLLLLRVVGGWRRLSNNGPGFGLDQPSPRWQGERLRPEGGWPSSTAPSARSAEGQMIPVTAAEIASSFQH
jgi:Na+-driven multidrug efflux pump